MLILVATAFASGFAITIVARLVARRTGVMAIPNARSAHSVPVANVGGLGFAIPTLLWLCWTSIGWADPYSVVLAGASLTVALIGFADDLVDLDAFVRLAIHLAMATLIAVVAIDGSPLLIVVCALGLAWFINLYNFMDGIDGIAGSQAVIFCLGALYFGTAGAHDATLWVLLASCAGFLCLNWAPAKVIMGDTGSGFLGIVIGGLALHLWQTGTLSLVTSLLLLATFWFDASYTLAVRCATRQRIAEAHNHHLYQRLARRWGHGRTTALLWAYAAVWLAPLAALYERFGVGPLWLALACVPLLVACVAFRAGLPSSTHQG